MDAPFQRARALDTTEALQHATITANDGSTRPLVKAGTSQDDLAGVAAAVSAMATAYDSLPSDGSIAAAQHPAAMARARGLAAASGFEVVASVAVGAAPASERLAAAIAPMSAIVPMSAFNWIEVGAGDLLGALESAGDYVVHIVKETGSDVWHFVASIGGKLYSFVFERGRQGRRRVDGRVPRHCRGDRRFYPLPRAALRVEQHPADQGRGQEGRAPLGSGGGRSAVDAEGRFRRRPGGGAGGRQQLGGDQDRRLAGLGRQRRQGAGLRVNGPGHRQNPDRAVDVPVRPPARHHRRLLRRYRRAATDRPGPPGPRPPVRQRSGRSPADHQGTDRERAARPARSTRRSTSKRS